MSKVVRRASILMKLKDPSSEVQNKSAIDSVNEENNSGVIPVKLPESKVEENEDAVSKKIGFMRQMVKMNEEDQKKE